MKTKMLLLTTMLMTTFFSLSAQNYIGQSKSKIINDLKKEFDFGVIQDVSEEEQFILKYSNFTGNIIIYFYFDSKGKCEKFTIINKNLADYKSVVRDLNRRFVKSQKNMWVQKGDLACQWRLDRKENFFALTVTKSL